MLPFSEQNHIFTIEGHRWPLEPGMAGSDLLNAAQIGATETLYIELEDGAEGQLRASGDYLCGDHREAYREAGLWGLFRVYEPDDAAAILHRLGDG